MSGEVSNLERPHSLITTLSRPGTEPVHCTRTSARGLESPVIKHSCIGHLGVRLSFFIYTRHPITGQGSLSANRHVTQFALHDYIMNSSIYDYTISVNFMCRIFNLFLIILVIKNIASMLWQQVSCIFFVLFTVEATWSIQPHEFETLSHLEPWRNVGKLDTSFPCYQLHA